VSSAPVATVPNVEVDTSSESEMIRRHRSAHGGSLRLATELFFQSTLALIGAGVLLIVVLFCFVGPLLYHTNQVVTNIAIAHQPPSLMHLLGTDELGYDELGRLMVGGQSTLEIGVAAGLLGTGFGLLWGGLAGFVGGWVDAVMMRVVDTVLAIPALFLLLFMATIVTPSVPVLIIILGFVSWTVPSRLVRGEALAQRRLDYVTAARGMGAKTGRIVRSHILPNTIGTVVVTATFQIANAILFLAALSFLGLGIPAPATNWGEMLASGMNFTYAGYWWLIFPPGLLIVVVVAAFNFVGDAVRDVVDARLKQR